jgi:hypothetical protein
MNPIRWPPSCRFPVCVLHRSLPDHMRFIVGLLAVVTLAFGSGCVQKDWIDRTLVTVDVTGTWEGTMEALAGGGGGLIRLELHQEGSIVTGQMQSYARSGSIVPSGPIAGSLAGDVFRFRNARESLTAELAVDGDEMKGHAVSAWQFRVSLRRVDPSSPPASPPR